MWMFSNVISQGTEWKKAGVFQTVLQLQLYLVLTVILPFMAGII